MTGARLAGFLLIMLSFLLSKKSGSLVLAQSPSLDIKVDQLGYIVSAPKFAFVVSTAATGTFNVRRESDGGSEFSSNLKGPVLDADTGDSVRLAEFTSVIKPGRYYLDVAGVGRSFTFTIGDASIYEQPFYLAMRAFYGLRCNTAISFAPDFPQYSKGKCHLNTMFHTSSGKSGAVSAESGGWHDAGDFGRYMPNAAIATGTLLHAFEMFSSRIRTTRLNIPESGSSVPDMLSEIRWNLRWMLTMQDTDGGCWHKQTSEAWPGYILPEADSFVNYVIGTGKPKAKGTCATAGLAAVGAIASRVFRPYDAAFADTCLNAAKKAWTWASANPTETFTANPPPVQSGMYDDADCSDDLFWAAAELARTTGESVYETYFTSNYRKFTIGSTVSWQSVSGLGFYTYILRGTGIAADLRNSLLQQSDGLVARITAANYKHSLRTEDYVWGSNSVALNHALQLMVAYNLNPMESYRNSVMEILHYLLGRNTFSKSFVTRIGTNYVRNLHFRQEIADGIDEPWPGYISGGPNAQRLDTPSSSLPAGTPPAKVYVDSYDSYATNEMAINWNSPLVFVLAGLMHSYSASATPAPTTIPPSTTLSPTTRAPTLAPTACLSPTQASVLTYVSPPSTISTSATFITATLRYSSNIASGLIVKLDLLVSGSFQYVSGADPVRVGCGGSVDITVRGITGITNGQKYLLNAILVSETDFLADPSNAWKVAKASVSQEITGTSSSTPTNSPAPTTVAPPTAGIPSASPTKAPVTSAPSTFAPSATPSDSPVQDSKVDEPALNQASIAAISLAVGIVVGFSCAMVVVWGIRRRRLLARDTKEELRTVWL